MNDPTEYVLVSPCEELSKVWNGFAAESELVSVSSCDGRFWCLLNAVGHGIRIVTDPIFALLGATGTFAASLVLSPFIAYLGLSYACEFFCICTLNIASFLTVAALSPFSQTVLMARALAGAIFHPGAYYYKEQGSVEFNRWRNNVNVETEIVNSPLIENNQTEWCKILKNEAIRLSHVKVPQSTDIELIKNKKLFLEFLDGQSDLSRKEMIQLQAYARNNGWLKKGVAMIDHPSLRSYEKERLRKQVIGREYLVTDAECNEFSKFIGWVSAAKYEYDGKFPLETQMNYYKVMQESLASLAKIWEEGSDQKEGSSVCDDKKASAIVAITRVATECKPARVEECQRQLLDIQEPKTPKEFVAFCIKKYRDNVIDTLVVKKGNEIEQYNDANIYRQCISKDLQGVDGKLAKQDEYAKLNSDDFRKYRMEFFEIYTKKALLAFVRGELNDENLWNELDNKKARMVDRKDMRTAWIGALYEKAAEGEEKSLKNLYEELQGDASLMQSQWVTCEKELYLTDAAIEYLLKDEFAAIQKATRK